MSLFGEQLETRLQNDAKAVARNERQLGAALGGRRSSATGSRVSAGSVTEQMDLIAGFFHIDTPEIAAEGRDADEVIAEYLRVTNIAQRSVLLTGPWWKDADGPLLARTKDDNYK